METRGSILIIDDDEDFRRSLGRLLRMDGFEVDMAGSFEEAAAKEALGSFFVILLDRRLPDGLAEEILPRLRSLAPDSAVIVLTGFADLEGTVKIFREGADDFLIKPVDHALLLKTITKHLDLRQSRQTVREHDLVLRSVHDAIISIDHDGVIETWNPAAERIYGYSSEEAIGMSAERLYVLELGDSLANILRPSSPTEPSGELDLRARRKCGAEIYVVLRLTYLTNDSGEVTGLIACSNDVTEQRRLRERLVQIGEEERRRIGQDLHDDLCQQLAGIACVARVAQESLEEDGDGRAEAVGDIAKMINEANAHARAIARGFMPVLLESKGIEAALFELAATTERLFRIECRVMAEPGAIIPVGAGVQIYRIVQEAISNAIKHGNATEILIRMTAAEGETLVEIADNGIGIEHDPGESGGMGMVTMGLRAGVIGGRLEVGKRQGGGTEVTCWIPNRPD